MMRWRSFASSLPAALTCLAIAAHAEKNVHGAPSNYPYLTWQDEFDGSTIDNSCWAFDLGTGSQYGLTGWGNNELQYYTSRSQNASVSGGLLRITARKESYGGQAYTSARLKTQGKFDQVGGRFEIRAALPTGQGLWPAIWMLPASDSYGTWAASGEIDIMEARGQQPDRVQGTIHYGGSWPDNVSSSGTRIFPAGQSISGFHTYALEWDATGSPAIRWYVDNVLYATKTSWWTSGGVSPAPFDRPFSMLLNLAVGGNYVGDPNASTAFPATMQVDYVRAYTAAPPPSTLTWYGNSATAGGTGTWTMSSTWSDGAGVRAWSPGATAVFSGSAGTVTLGSTTTVNGGLQFRSSGYTIAGANLMLGGTSGMVQVASGATATVTAAITGSAGLQKTGPGTLVLNAANSLTGTVAIASGTLALAQSAAIGVPSLIEVSSTAALDIRTLAGGLMVNASQTLAGSGTILGSVTFGRGSTLAPGMMSSAMGARLIGVQLDQETAPGFTAAVPEPSTLWLGLCGAAWAGSQIARRMKKAGRFHLPAFSRLF